MLLCDRWRTLCCFVIVVIVATTCTVCNRRWSTCPLVRGAAHNASSFLEVLVFCYFWMRFQDLERRYARCVTSVGGGGGGGGVFGSYPYDLSLTRHVSSHTLTAVMGVNFVSVEHGFPTPGDSSFLFSVD